MTYTYTYKSILGNITLAGNENALTGLWFDGQKYFGSTLPEEYAEKKLPVFAETTRWLDIYFSGKDPGFIPPLSFSASPFREMVWKILLSIPYGQAMTYGAIADKIAAEKGIAKMSAQAAGGAVGHNPISIIVPCHRVVGTNGSLTGYAGGMDRKIKLLELEKINMQNLFIPKNSLL